MEGQVGGSGEEFAVGCLLSIKTTLGDEFDGQVMAFDRFTNMLVIHILSFFLFFFFFNKRKLFSLLQHHHFSSINQSINQFIQFLSFFNFGFGYYKRV